MFKVAYLLLFFVILASCGKKKNSSTPTWPKAYFSYAPGIHKAADLLSLPNDEGYLLLASYQSYTSSDVFFYLVKADTAGNLIWQNIYGDVGYQNIPKRVKLRSSGDYLLVGDQVGTQSKMQLITVAPTNGAVISSGIVSVAAGHNEQISDATEDADGNIIAIGSTTQVSIKPETHTYGAYDVTDVAYVKLDASYNIINKAGRGFIGADKGVACFVGNFSGTQRSFFTCQTSPRTGGSPGSPIFESRMESISANHASFGEFWHYMDSYTSDITVVGAVINTSGSTPFTTQVGQAGQNIITYSIDADGILTTALKVNNTAISGSVEVKSIELLPNGNYLIATVLTNGSDRNVHTMLLDANHNVISETNTGEIFEQETVARAVPATGYNVFVADIANAYTQAPAQFVNEPDTIVLGIAQ